MTQNDDERLHWYHYILLPFGFALFAFLYLLVGFYEVISRNYLSRRDRLKVLMRSADAAEAA
jgi:hypothetical protein